MPTRLSVYLLTPRDRQAVQQAQTSRPTSSVLGRAWGGLVGAAVRQVTRELLARSRSLVLPKQEHRRGRGRAHSPVLHLELEGGGEAVDHGAEQVALARRADLLRRLEEEPVQRARACAARAGRTRRCVAF